MRRRWQGRHRRPWIGEPDGVCYAPRFKGRDGSHGGDEENALLFVGTYEHTIDAKQRVAVPSDIRDRLDPQADGKDLYAVLLENSTLALYTQHGFEKRAEELDHSERSPDEVLLYEQLFYANAARLEIDPQGRVRLPERLLKLAGLGRDVVFIGVKDHLELHDRQAWNDRMTQLLAQRKDLLMNPRRAMKAPAAKTQG